MWQVYFFLHRLWKIYLPETFQASLCLQWLSAAHSMLSGKTSLQGILCTERIRTGQKWIPFRLCSFRNGTKAARRCGVSSPQKGAVPAPYLCSSCWWTHEIWKNPVYLYKQWTLSRQSYWYASYCTHAPQKKCFQNTQSRQVLSYWSWFPVFWKFIDK